MNTALLIRIVAVAMLSVLLVLFASGIDREKKNLKALFAGLVSSGLLLCALCAAAKGAVFVLPVAAPALGFSLLASLPAGYAALLGFVSFCAALSPVFGGAMCGAGEVLYLLVTGAFLLAFFSFPRRYMPLAKRIVVYILVCLMCAALFLFPEYEGREDFILLLCLGIGLGTLSSFGTAYLLLHLRFKRDDATYEKINDPEYELLMELKKNHKEEYYVALHSAVLCHRIATAMDLDPGLCRCLGYYHRIGVLDGNALSSGAIAGVNAFPAAAVRLIEEYNGPSGESPAHIETVITRLANDIVSSIRYLASKGSKDIDYEKIITFIFRKKAEAGFFDKCKAGPGEIRALMEHFIKEKLYYDFLR
ncbi:MAG: hypothetical protein IKR68_09380 [Lachnospiraceae bacterium]|nr:hypothetical protein [Lachnospiraceae bacterium]